MSTGLLSPDAALREFSDLGLVLSGAKLHTYVSGTPSTPLVTYSESTLVTQNANPVVASVGGLFGPIYLTPGVAYKYVLADSSDVTIWTRDPVMVPAAADPGYVDGSRIKASDGTVGAPGLTFNSDADNGLYLEGTNAIGFSTAGVKALGIDATGFIDSPTQPRCVAYHNTTQSIPDSTTTVLSFNSEDLDVGTMHDLVTNNSRVTVPASGDGLYLAIASVSYAAPVGNVMFQVSIKKNGTTELERLGIEQPATGGLLPRFTISTLVALVATDYLEVTTFQNSGGAVNAGFATRALSNSLSLVKLW